VELPAVVSFTVFVDSGNPEGVRVQRSAGPTRLLTTDLAAERAELVQEDWYRAALARPGAHWSEPYFDRGGSDRNVVRVSAPIFLHPDDEHAAGAVSAVVSLDWLRRLANTNEFSDSSHVIVFSREGRLVLHPKPTFAIAETMDTLAEKTGAPELAAIRQKVAAHRQGAIDYTDGLSGRRIRANFKPAKTAGWGVVAVYDEAEFLQPQHAFRRLAAGFLAAALLVVAVVVVWVSRQALRPLAPLAEAAGKIARGDLDADIAPPRREDEMGALTAAFRQMQQGLKMQQLQDRWAAKGVEQQLRYNQLIIDSVGELVFVLTKALNISRINRAVLLTAGYNAADVVKMPFGRFVSMAAATPAAPLVEAMNQGTPLRDVAVTITTHDGEALAGWLMFAPLVDSNRIVGGVVTIRTDRRPSHS